MLRMHGQPNMSIGFLLDNHGVYPFKPVSYYDKED